VKGKSNRQIRILIKIIQLKKFTVELKNIFIRVLTELIRK
jgi:hypothetical protein